MRNTIVHRLVVPAVALLGIALWAAPTLAAPESFRVALTGAQQSPAVQTSGMGTANLTYDPTTRVVNWTISYSGLSGPVTMAHFHGPAEMGKNGGVQIWLSKQGSPADSPITGTATLTPEQATQFTAGQWYVNLHTQAHPGGEVRGQVMPPKS
jgi:hypothetical protein